jgi:hypothetical protein
MVRAGAPPLSVSVRSVDRCSHEGQARGEWFQELDQPRNNSWVSESVRSGQKRIELRQSTSNLVQFPIFIGILVLAVAFRVEGSQSTVVYIICAVAAVLDVVFAFYLLRNARAMLVITPDEITFTKGDKVTAPQQVIHRVDGSSLSFRVAANGPVGSKYTGYVLKLRDNATGHEVYAGAFGRKKVQQACESQGWSFDGA